MSNSKGWATLALLGDARQLTGRSAVQISHKPRPESCNNFGIKVLDAWLHSSLFAMRRGEINACQKALSSSMRSDDGTSRSDAWLLDNGSPSPKRLRSAIHVDQSDISPVADGDCTHSSDAADDGDAGDRLSHGDRCSSLSEGACPRSKSAWTPEDAVAMAQGLSLKTPVR